MINTDKLKPYQNLLAVGLNDYKTMSSQLSDLSSLETDDLHVLYMYAKDICLLFGIDDSLKTNLQELLDLFNSTEFAERIDQFEEIAPELFLQLATMKLIIQSLLNHEETILTSLRLLEAGISKLLDLQIKNCNVIKGFIPDGISEAFKQVNSDG